MCPDGAMITEAQDANSAGYWVFEARIRYGRLDVTVPITLRIEWAGDTPVIQVTDMAIPGLGDAFTARILVYRGEYAGTWAHGKVGGQMFGVIEPAHAQTKEKKQPKP